LPSIQSPLGALPSRFRRERVLIVGCGDVGMRVVRELRGRVVVRALTPSVERVAELRAAGVTPLIGDLDKPGSLGRLAGLATRLVHLAPPATEHSGAWWRDVRTLSLMRVLARRQWPSSTVYVSTSGVYGDCAGERVPEWRTPQPRTPRAQRRVDAERVMRHFGRRGARVSLLRVPGIYAPDRPGGARERLLRGTPVLEAGDDVYTNHIHADDLARAVIAALWRGAPQRIYNVCDDTEMKMGDYFDLAADLYGLPRPRRVPRSPTADELPLSVLSFMNESRRLDNDRLKRELRLQLRYAEINSGLR
jgi:nucleoside-diphosphate-sugar epimerase